MDTHESESDRVRLFLSISALFLLVACFFFCPAETFAAKTPDGLWVMQQGQNPTQYGDIVSSCQTTGQGSAVGGYCSYYRYFIEVPYATPPDSITLALDIFDADVNAGGGNETTAGRDRNLGGTGTTVYTLYDPAGNQVATASCGTTCNGALAGMTVDNVWARFATVTNPVQGHWELRVTSSSATYNRAYVNAYGLHAYDIAGGKELNMYSSSYVELGMNANNAPRTYSVYPYVTYGPQFYSHDFDMDDGNAPNDGGYLRFVSRTGATDYTTGNAGQLLSNNDAWNNFGMNIYTTDYWSGDYGIWREDITVMDYGPGTGNYGVFFNSASATPPVGQNTTPGCQITGTNSPHRMYFPTENGTAPLKPYLTHQLAYKSGPNPPSNGSTTVLTITLAFTNPSPYPVAFSQSANPAKVITTNVPGGTALYGGNSSASQGTIIAEPALGGSGDVVWDPGIVAGGTTVTLSYDVSATPAAAGQRVALTGSGATGATAFFVDETQDYANPCASVTFGPLAALAVTEGSNVAKPVLALTKSGPPVVSWVNPGPSTITYSLTYQNLGSVDSTNTVVTDVLAAGLTFVSASNGGTYNGGNRTVTWNIGTVAAGASGTLTLTVTAGRGTFTNSGAIRSSEITAPLNSNTTTTIVGGLLVSKSTSTPSRTYPTNTTATYTITVVNQGTTTANDVIVSDVLPPGFTYNATTTFTGCQGGTGCGGGRICPTAGAARPVWMCTTTIAAGGTMTITFSANITASATPGTYDNAVNVTSMDEPVIQFDEHSTTAEDVTLRVNNDLAVTMAITSISSPCYAPTCQITYQVTVTNVGVNASTSSTVTDTWPAELSTPTWSATNGGTYNTGTGVWTVGGLAAGASATLTLTATLNTYAAAVTNVAALTASNPADTDASNNRASLSFAPTLVSMGGFSAYEEGGGVTVEWTTLYERDTAGFYLYRLHETTGKYVRLNKKLLPGLITSPQGGTYRIMDRGAVAGKTYTYLLEEVERGGKRNSYGPYTVSAGSSPVMKATRHSMPSGANLGTGESGEQTVAISGAGQPVQGDDVLHGYTHRPHPRKIRSAGRGKSVSVVKSVNARKSGSLIKMVITEEGLYRLDASSISALLGISVNDATVMIRKGMLSLSSGGEDVSYAPMQGNSGILFYGKATNTNYTDETVYWLKPSPGMMMEVVEAAGASAGASGVYTASKHFEQDVFDYTSAFADPEADYWFWEFVVAGDETAGRKTFTMNTPGISASGGTAEMTVNLQGGTDTGHHAVVNLNGTVIGGATWSGIAGKTFTISFDQGLLTAGDNTVEIRGELDGDVPYSIFYVNSFDIAYQKEYRAENDRLWFRGDGNPTVTVTGFTRTEISLYDLSDPLKPKKVTGATVSGNAGSYAISFVPASPETPYLALTEGRTLPVEQVRARTTGLLKGKNSGADYLIITSEELKDSVARLAAYRQGQGFRTMTVLVEQIMDEFNYGSYSPLAIRKFLANAYRNWTTRPRFVVLAGSGTYDYKDNMRLGGNQVPVLMVGTPQGLFPSDTRYGDMDLDRAPDLFIGRLPGAGPAEVETLIGKILAYESSPGGSWTKRAIAAADVAGDGGNFPADRDAVAATLPLDYTVQKVTVGEGPFDQVRAGMLEGIRNGVVMVNYIGHGALERFAQDGLLVKEDVDGMTNAVLPFVAGMTCVAGNYGIPGAESLSEALVLKQGGGALAVWSPTGLSLNDEAVVLDKELMKRLFGKGRGRTLGEAVTLVLEDYARGGGMRYMVDIYNLLGDPALVLKR